MMDLLLDRSQKKVALFSLIPLRFGSGMIFHLRAELELDDEEAILLKKYGFQNSTLVASDLWEDLKAALKPAAILGVIAFVIIFFAYSFNAAIVLSPFLILFMTVVYFFALRELIIVRHLLDGGRMFRCDSIIELVHKEAYLHSVCEYLRQVLESAKNWDDREKMPIVPLNRQQAKLAVLRKLYAL